MGGLLAILASPNKQGVSDRLATAFAAGFKMAGGNADFIALRDHKIIPCQACQVCFFPPCKCLLSKKDAVHELFTRMKNAALLLFASPIYFYALPAHFKSLIDRGQIFYARKRFDILQNRPQLPPAISILCAGRKQGEKLFTGAILSLRCFMQAASSCLEQVFAFRGLETPANIKMQNIDCLWQAGFSYGIKNCSPCLK